MFLSLKYPDISESGYVDLDIVFFKIMTSVYSKKVTIIKNILIKGKLGLMSFFKKMYTLICILF